MSALLLVRAAREAWSEKEEEQHPRGLGDQGGQFIKKDETPQPTKKPGTKPPKKAKPDNKPKGEKSKAVEKVEAAKPARKKPLRRGDSGPEVRILQRLLNSLGISVSANGTFGYDTERAVREVQQKLGLKPTGRVSAALIRRLSDAKKLSPCVKESVSALDLVREARRVPDFDAALHPRDDEGKFRTVFNRVNRALTAWAKGDGPDRPISSLRLSRPTLMKVARKIGYDPSRGEDADSIEDGILARAREIDKARRADAPDAPDDVDEPDAPEVEKLFTAADKEQAEKILSRLPQGEFERGIANPKRTRKELSDTARLLGLPTSGTKEVLQKRLADRAEQLRKGDARESPAVAKPTDRRVLDALAAAPRGRYLALANLREQLGDVDRQDLDQALLQLARDGRIILTPEEDRRRIKKRERDAAVRFGDQEQHWVTLDDAPESPPAAKVQAAKKATPKADGGRRTLPDRQRELLAKAAANDVIEVDKSDPDVQALVAAGYIDLDPRSNRAEINGRGALKAKLLRPDAPAKKATPSKATPRKPAAPDPTVRAVEVDNLVREAYRDAIAAGDEGPFGRPTNGRTPAAGDYVMLAGIRERIGDKATRQEVDEALARFAREGRVQPQEDQKRLKPKDRESALQWGGGEMHMISLDDPSPRPLPTPPRKASPRVPKESPAPKATLVKAAPADIAAKLESVTSREEAHNVLKGKSAAELREIAKAANVAVPSKATKERLTDDIVQVVVGRRLTSDAVSGHVAGSGVAPQSRTDVPDGLDAGSDLGLGNLAEEHGLSGEGSRAELLERLRKAGVKAPPEWADDYELPKPTPGSFVEEKHIEDLRKASLASISLSSQQTGAGRQRNARLDDLRRMGYLRREGDRYFITDEGRAYLASLDVAKRSVDLNEDDLLRSDPSSLAVARVRRARNS